jgi:hypothetical protein
MATRSRLAAGVIAAALMASSGSLIACDREDQRDVQEGVNEVKEGVEEGVNELEEEVDENVDTDGQDDQ